MNVKNKIIFDTMMQKINILDAKVNQKDEIIGGME